MTEYEKAALNSLFFLGQAPGLPGQPIVYPFAADQRSHLAYYGTTRSGKTYAIEHALRQLARSRRAGFCYIDPHGSSYWRMASFLRQHRIGQRVLFWDINDPEYVVTYDPFDIPGRSPSYIAGNLTSALLATLGHQVGASEQPHLKTVTEDGLLALLDLKLPFGLSQRVFDPTEVMIKRAVAARSGRAAILRAIAKQNEYRDRKVDLEAPFRRFYNLFQDDRLRLTFTTSGLNFRTLMDDGWIVLVNTEPKDQHDEAATLFTRLLVKHIFMIAKQRPKSSANRPFFLFIDEASRYLTSDTARILAETAGYGLYLGMGMQSIEQAKRENEETYNAIRSCVNVEAVMRLTDVEEALYFARRFYGPHLDFKTVKDEQIHTSAIPRSVEHVITATQRGSSNSGSSGTSTPLASLGYPQREGHRMEQGGFTSVDLETTTPGWHVDYDYQRIRATEYYPTDQLEFMAARRFMLREENQGQRLGVVRVNETEPADIEIPQLDPPMYSREEMTDWLTAFKANQAGTLPLIEARSTFDALIDKHVQLLMADEAEPLIIDDQRTRTPTRSRRIRPSPTLNPATPKAKPAKGSSGQEG